MRPRLETADLHGRILAAAAKNGRSELSFRRMCANRQRNEEMSRLLDRINSGAAWVHVDVSGKPSFVWGGAA